MAVVWLGVIALLLLPCIAVGLMLRFWEGFRDWVLDNDWASWAIAIGFFAFEIAVLSMILLSDG